MEGYVYLGAFLVLMVIFAIQSYRTTKAKLEKLEKLVNNNYGEASNKKYKKDELEHIASYYRYLKEKNKDSNTEYIDDVTWNDLDMDGVFMKINNTYSSVGETYLYNMLRCPKSIEELEEFGKLVDSFKDDENTAKGIQKQYSFLGRTKKINIIEFIHRLTEIEGKNNFAHYLMIVVFIASVALLLTVPPVGIIAFIASVAINVVSYSRMKRNIEEYFMSFRYLVNIMKFSEKLAKELPDEFVEYTKDIERINSNFKNVKRNLFLIADNIDGSIAGLVMDYIRMIFHVDIIKFNNMLDETLKNIDDVDKLYAITGRIEAAIAIASYRQFLDNKYEGYCIPEIVNDKKIFDAEMIFHPLIKEPVKNSIAEEQSVLLTGSNASGKSTFLKTVAINVILGRTIYTCLAKNIKMAPFRVYSSMSLRDDLSKNESYYIVEIKSLKRILDNSMDERPMICFVDEVLRGTNTVERISASSEILKSLSKNNVLCFAATHDIELTYLLEQIYSNYHFEENIVDDDVKFNYRLNNGRATTRNAISLLKVIGYDDSIIKKARDRAERFLEDGVWT